MLVYLISLSLVSLVFVNYIMGLGYIALGFFWVCGFFGMVALCSKNWRSMSGPVSFGSSYLISSMKP